MSDPFLQAHNIGKTFQQGKTRALQGVSLDLNQGDFVFITGPSGGGKSTLLNICSGISTPDEGAVTFLGKNIYDLNETQRTELRRDQFGIVFQFFQLIPSLTAVENVEFPSRLKGKRARDRALALLERLGIHDKYQRYPCELSGGEQQRVGIARAMINNPKIIFADEPTGSLDSRASSQVMEIFETLHKEEGISILFVTHNRSLIGPHRELQILDGHVVGEPRGLP